MHIIKTKISLDFEPSKPFGSIKSNINHDEVVIEKDSGGDLYINEQRITAKIYPGQNAEFGLLGSDLLDIASKQDTLVSASLLDFLMSDRKFIPREFQSTGKDWVFIFFFGTIYESKSGEGFARYLTNMGGGWFHSVRYLKHGFDKTQLITTIERPGM